MFCPISELSGYLCALLFVMNVFNFSLRWCLGELF